MSIKKRIVGVVGLGHVGAHVAYNLGMMGVADEVKLCDKNADKVASECNDLMDAAYFMPHRVVYKVVDYAGLADCDVIVNAVGKIELLATLNRDSEMENSVREVASFVDKIMAGGFDGIFVNITNPCDVITDLVQKLSGLPRNRVFGTGTGLDSSRLISAISQQTNLEHHSFTAFMMGEHGNAQMVPWSLISFHGKPLSEHAALLVVILHRSKLYILCFHKCLELTIDKSIVGVTGDFLIFDFRLLGNARTYENRYSLWLPGFDEAG